MRGSSDLSLLLLLLLLLVTVLSTYGRLRGEGQEGHTRGQMTIVSGSRPVHADQTRSPTEEELTTKTSREVKIVGGSRLTPHQQPYLVLVSRLLGDVASQICGGSVLDRWHVLSAAHCFQFPSPTQYSITAGEHNTSATEGTEQHRRVERVFNHPQYDAKGIQNDVAVLRLTSPLTLTYDAVRAIDVTDSEACPPVPSLCSVSGWGVTEEDGAVSDVPLTVAVPVLPRDNCSTVYPDYLNQICAGSHGLDSCQGDSGGPLTCRCGARTLQTGVVSKGRGCGRKGYPGMYTKLRHYLPWIRDVMAGKYR